MDAWFIVIGVILLLMALLGSLVDRLPMSSGLVYLAIGFALGPAGVGWLVLDPVGDAAGLELLLLVAVLVSLFTIGLKLRTPSRLLSGHLWRYAIRLAGPAMLVTIALVALFGTLALGFPLGAAILLGAILAPTDPVLASDIQVRHEDDRDDARFALSAEGGLNDASASPFVMLGLGLLGLHDLGTLGWHWIALDVAWGTVAGFGIGWLCGLGVGSLVLVLRRRLGEGYGLEEFLGLGLIALAYGLADLVRGIGFLSVLAAALAMRRFESHALKDLPEVPKDQPLAESQAKAALPPESPTHLVGQVLDFNQRFESIGEVAAVIVLGALLSAGSYSLEGLGVALVLTLLIRPASVYLAMRGSQASASQRRMMGWFGIRGIGTLYYLMVAIRRDLPEALVDRILPIVLTVVAFSIVVHGMSATPMMAYYERRKRRIARRSRPT